MRVRMVHAMASPVGFPNMSQGALLRAKPRPELKADTKLPLKAVVEELDYRAFKIDIGRDFVLFSLYFAFFVGLLVLHSNTSTVFQMQDVITRNIVTDDLLGSVTPFDNLKMQDEVFIWMESVLVPNVYKKFWYNGDVYSAEIDNTIAHQTKLIGGMRFLQKRRSETYNDGYCYPSVLDKISDKCLEDVHDHDQYLCEGRSCCSGPVALSPHMCCSQPSNCSYVDVNSAFVEQQIDGYQGYIVDFNLSLRLTDAQMMISSLKKGRWLDDKTKSLDILLTAYNPNFKRFMTIDLQLETSLVGYMTGTSLVRVLDLDPYAQNNPEYDDRMAVDIIWLILASVLLLWNFVKTVTLLLLPGNKLQNLFEFVDMGIPVGYLVTIFDFLLISKFLEMYHHSEAKNVMDTLHDYEILSSSSDHRFSAPAFTSYVSLSNLAALDVQLYSIVSIALLLHVLMALHAFRISLNAEQLMNSLGKAVPDVLGFGPLYLVIITGYALAGYILYGSHFEQFHTVENAFFAVFQLNFGLLDISPLHEHGGIGSKLFLATSLIVFTMILLNIVLSIIMRAWEVTQREIEHRKLLHTLGFQSCTLMSVARDILHSTNLIRRFSLNLRNYNPEGWISEKGEVPTITRLALKREIEHQGFNRDLSNRALKWFSLDAIDETDRESKRGGTGDNKAQIDGKQGFPLRNLTNGAAVSPSADFPPSSPISPTPITPGHL